VALLSTGMFASAGILLGWLIGSSEFNRIVFVFGTLLILGAAALLPLGMWSRLVGRVFADERTFRIAMILLLFALFMGATWLRSDLREDPTWSTLELAGFALLVAVAVMLAARRWTYVAATAILLAALGGMAQLQQTLSDVRTRSYFGIYTVEDFPSGERLLMHGTTLHGMQWRDPKRATRPTTYYGPTGGAGLALLAADRLYGPNARIGVVGLGVGTLSCYRRPGQSWTFFEIDPEVLAYSQRGKFTYLKHCAGNSPVVIGDARLKLAEEPAGSLDMLLVDAFSSDAIPLHLLTDEAVGVYFHALAPDGLLVIHISNRFVDLQPVLAALARERGLYAARRSDIHTLKAGSLDDGLSSSHWVVLARDKAKIAALTTRGGWEPLSAPAADVWRDDFASILPHLTWRTFF
ncbi:MAG TPA: fused MFS/spermidine synthase, partial [Croceibacterium sp.]|nr:fused MFS/spermidine synthase [Croceibacterium sp.]